MEESLLVDIKAEEELIARIIQLTEEDKIRWVGSAYAEYQPGYRICSIPCFSSWTSSERRLHLFLFPEWNVSGCAMRPILRITTIAQEKEQRLFGHKMVEKERHQYIDHESVQQIWNVADRKLSEALSGATRYVRATREQDLKEIKNAL